MIEIQMQISWVNPFMISLNDPVLSGLVVIRIPLSLSFYQYCFILFRELEGENVTLCL